LNECLEEQNPSQWDDVDTDELRQCILDTKVFSEVQLTLDAPVVELTVKERWTVIPIPFVRAQRDSNRYGFFLFDSNFLGRGKQAVIGASAGNRGNTFFALYRDPAIIYGKWTGLVKYKKGQEDYVRYKLDNEIDGYNEKEDTAELRMGYKLSPWLEAALQMEITKRRFDILDPFSLSLQDYRYIYLGPFLGYDHTDFHFYFQEGNKFRLEMGSQIYRDDDAAHVTQYQLIYDWQHAVYRKHALQLHLESRARNTNDVRDSFKLGSNLGFRGVESAGIWAKQAHSVSVDYKIPFLDIKYGTWTIGPFADYATFKEFDADDLKESIAYGISTFMFLKKIALPGIGIIVGHNDKYLGDFVSVSIGFAM
jgi:outer membrane protein assembly factor BamA